MHRYIYYDSDTPIVFVLTVVNNSNSQPVIDLSNEPEECETTKKKKRKYNTTSFNIEYALDEDNPQPGDLVMGQLTDIEHPAKDSSHFGPRYFILGAVVGFARIGLDAYSSWKRGMSYEKYANKERLVIAWQTIRSAHVRYIQKTTYNKMKYFRHIYLQNVFVNVPPTYPFAVSILNKAGERSIDNMNQFLWETVHANFDWDVVNGWSYRKPTP